MGLDWNPGNKPRPGSEAEFERLFHLVDQASGSDRDALLKRFFEVSVSAYETLQAPRVGTDENATAWARGKYAENAAAAESEAAFLTKLHGFYVVDLVSCDGVPPYSNGGAGQYVEAFSFRGQFLTDCVAEIGEPRRRRPELC